MVFRDHPKLKDKDHAYTERVQLSGLCYMHAPVVLQHYLVAMQNEVRMPSLDMALYMRRYPSADELENHIWDNIGGSSSGFAESILLKGTEFLYFGPDKDFLPDGAIESSLELYGPALVAYFRVDEDFCDKDMLRHIGPRDKKQVLGKHAMLLVGHRQESDKKLLLLQNWWRSKQFIEVDAEYLESTRTILYFVKTPQHAIPN